MTNADICCYVGKLLKWIWTVETPYEPIWTFESSPLRRAIAVRYADDPVRQGEFLKNLRATKEDMTTFELLTLDARAWCVAFLKTEGKWKEETK